ncbi:MAG: DinB family protein [Planctomycetota bacterium]|jgi:uncharacterized damage-inducible protein DinB
MVELLSHMLEIEHQANVALLDALNEADTEPLRIMRHIIDAQNHYLARWQGHEARAAEADEMLSLDRCRQQEGAAARAWQAWLGGIDQADLAWELEQENRAVRFRLSAADMIIHVVTHGFYHRAQIDSILRQSGREPPRAGYAYLARTRAGDAPGGSRNGAV